MIKYIFIYLFSVFISSVAQVILKSSAEDVHNSIIKEYLNIKVIVSYSILLCASLITIIAYKRVPFSFGIVLESSGYIFVTILSYVFLKEKIGKQKFLGMLCILMGIIISYI